jgi:hypothetical protein
MQSVNKSYISLDQLGSLLARYDALRQTWCFQNDPDEALTRSVYELARDAIVARLDHELGTGNDPLLKSMLDWIDGDLHGELCRRIPTVSKS